MCSISISNFVAAFVDSQYVPNWEVYSEVTSENRFADKSLTIAHNYVPLLYYHVSLTTPEVMPTVEDYTYPTVSKICRGNEKLMSTKRDARGRYKNISCFH